MKKKILIFIFIFSILSCTNGEYREIQENSKNKENKNYVNENTLAKDTDNYVNKKDNSDIEKINSDIEKINKVEHFEKYNLECEKFSTEEWKKYCWKTKIESHLFYLFRWYEWDDIYKIKKDVLEYENFMKKEQNYDDYGDFNMKLFIEWRDSDFWNNLIPSF